MKQIFLNKYFDWILIVITLFFSIETLFNLFSEFEFFSSYLLRIVFALASIFAFILLIARRGNGEKYSRFFIIIILIIPSLIIFNQFLVDSIFYGINRVDLLQNSTMYLKLITGITLFIFTIKYSKQTKSDQIKDYGILTIYIGIFLIGLILIRVIEPNFVAGLNNVPIWKVIVKTIIGLLIIYLGYRLKTEDLKLKTCLVLVLISMFIYGLI
ncbi:MAG: hypothetical protein ABI426_09240 [Flavobacterium sp.]